jgi:predicted Holliday junction resolvase-like endonuclease
MVGPQLYFPREAPYYRTGLIANMVVLCLMFVIVSAQMCYLMYLNKRNLNRRLALGKTGANVDYSLEDSSKWEKMRADAKAKATELGQEEVVNERAFEDLTDLQNEDFVYSL